MNGLIKTVKNWVSGTNTDVAKKGCNIEKDKTPLPSLPNETSSKDLEHT